MLTDHNFDPIADKFVNNIYGSEKGRIRKEVVWRELESCLQQLNKAKLRVLDAGGGFGYFSQKLAAMGHEVVLCDISEKLLSVAKAQIAGKSYQAQVQIIHCPIQDLAEHIDGQFDLILNHAVLEWLAEPEKVVAILASWLKQDGLLSLMFYNKEAQRFFNLVSGNFDFVKKGMPRKKVVRLSPTNPILEQDVVNWLSDLNMFVTQKVGVRVINDYLKPNSVLEAQEDSFEQLLAMEKQYARLEPYASLGRYIHFIVEKGD